MTDERILYLECASGISGDMTVAALLDLGADEEKLRAAIDSLALDGAQIHISRVKKSGLDACDFAVELDAAHENHDHDMEYLHGSGVEHDHAHDDYHGHVHNDQNGHDEHHGHTHDHHGHAHHHEHRGMKEIAQIIDRAQLTDGARALAYRMFDILADAEAKAHGVPREEVHFHEVGAVDSIIDIVAAAVCLDDLAPQRIVCSPLSEGIGTIRCQHGILPIPVPAVANIVAAYQLPVCRTRVQGELVTPTGAAIAAAVGSAGGELPNPYTIEKIGIGAGKRSYEASGILRAMWITPQYAGADVIVKLEANIDDATGEQLGYCMDCLMEAGARDVSFVPVYMKKNRPAYELHVICAPGDVTRMETIIFRETTTIGIRRSTMERTVMQRELKTVQTVYGEARVKVCTYGEIKKIYPEYDSVAAICRAQHLDFRKVYQMVQENKEI